MNMLMGRSPSHLYTIQIESMVSSVDAVAATSEGALVKYPRRGTSGGSRREAEAEA